jgi:hypothetical protein
MLVRLLVLVLPPLLLLPATALTYPYWPGLPDPALMDVPFPSIPPLYSCDRAVFPAVDRDLISRDLNQSHHSPRWQYLALPS